jgi:hypothetical protein
VSKEKLKPSSRHIQSNKNCLEKSKMEKLWFIKSKRVKKSKRIFLKHLKIYNQTFFEQYFVAFGVER